MGPDEGNPLQYTGRENDGTGLYYYRARYYDSVLKRFIAEDPIGIESADANSYAYAAGDPISLNDPEGLSSLALCANPANAAACAAAFGGTYGGATSLVANVASQLSQTGCVNWNQAAGATATGILIGMATGAASPALASGASNIANAVGPLTSWVRVGRTASQAMQRRTWGVSWGASVAKGGKYVQQIGNPTLQGFNQWLRNQWLPIPGWRALDPGHFHFWLRP